MQKKAMYTFYVTGEKYEEILPYVIKSREINNELIEKYLNIKLEPFEKELYEQPRWGDWIDGWSAEISEKIPEDKKGLISEITVVEAYFKKKNEEKETEGQEVIVAYFDTHPESREGESVSWGGEIGKILTQLDKNVDFDFYHFIGFETEEIVGSFKKISEKWNIGDVSSEKKQSNGLYRLIQTILGFIDIILVVLFILSATQIICDSYACLFPIFGILILLGISSIISIVMWVLYRKKRKNEEALKEV
ncbi:MAG: hypothetical protein H7644_01775 [Candidatus Heimdallarchaeota archaeon]|nr:hypothetical protein [Candidatus Heimdallarchaeota archaeon]MCK5142476.1 hypothetical protein [Candidatus Heimdallarchaeota archaeon]